MEGLRVDESLKERRVLRRVFHINEQADVVFLIPLPLVKPDASKRLGKKAHGPELERQVAVGSQIFLRLDGSSVNSGFIYSLDLSSDSLTRFRRSEITSSARRGGTGQACRVNAELRTRAVQQKSPRLLQTWFEKTQLLLATTEEQ